VVSVAVAVVLMVAVGETGTAVRRESPCADSIVTQLIQKYMIILLYILRV